MTGASINPVARESFNFWKAAGLPFVSCCAMLGNEEGETSFRPHSIGDHGEAFSIEQWHWERGAKILAGCGIDVRSCSHADALRAALWEFRHVDTLSWHLLMQTTTIATAVAVLVTRVENSKDKPRDIVRRSGFADAWAITFGSEKW